MSYETHRRAWMKSFVWRVLGVVILCIISLLITKSWKEMSIITVLFHGIRVVLYYFHERIWERVKWGRILHPLSSLPVNRELTGNDLKIVSDKLRELGYLE